MQKLNEGSNRPQKPNSRLLEMDVNAPYLSVPNYARHINCSVRNLYRLIERGVVPSIKLGYKCVRIPVAKADAHLDSLATGGSVAASKLASL